MDKQTFTDEVKARERQLYRVARSYLANDADCADAVQEALARAWAKRHTLREEALFGTWLTRILINECKTSLRKLRRTVPMAEPPDAGRGSPPEPDTGLRGALFGLEVKYRVPLVLSVLDGYTLREIAGLLHLPEGTVKTRVSRAKQQLRKTITQEVSGDEG